MNGFVIAQAAMNLLSCQPLQIYNNSNYLASISAKISSLITFFIIRCKYDDACVTYGARSFHIRGAIVPHMRCDRSTDVARWQRAGIFYPVPILTKTNKTLAVMQGQVI
jgi:hypothetical protein